jgi:hypothetical protein
MLISILNILYWPLVSILFTYKDQSLIADILNIFYTVFIFKKRLFNVVVAIYFVLTVLPIALAILTPIWPRPPMPTMPTLSPPLVAFQWFSGEYIVMPAHSTTPADSSGYPSGTCSAKKRRHL